MTAGAMILGMIPMALGVGEGGEQNAPLARAVIGGLLFATVAHAGFCADHVFLAAAACGNGKSGVVQCTNLSSVIVLMVPPLMPSMKRRTFPAYRPTIATSTRSAWACRGSDQLWAGTGRLLGLFVAVVAGVLIVAFFMVQRARHGDESTLRDQAAMRVQQLPPVEVVRAQTAPPIQTLVLPGETRGWYSSLIYTRVTGYVAKWLVDIGDAVTKDQVMALIDTPDLDAQLNAARAQLEAAEAEAKVKELDSEFARTTWVRWQTSAKGLVSEQEREDKKAHYQSSLAQLNAARARINLDRANVRPVDLPDALQASDRSL